MHIGEPVRMLTVEPVVDPVPRGDYPDRFADVGPHVPLPTPRAGVGRPEHQEIPAPVRT
jgi:hypothetical protein